MQRMLVELMVKKGMVQSRSQAFDLIRLGKVKVGNCIAADPAMIVNNPDSVKIIGDVYVSRAGYKLESAAAKLKLNFKGKMVLDVGSSTGGFTQYALKHGASKVVAVDIGSDQLHPTLRGDKRIELHEKTDVKNMNQVPAQMVLIDVSFVSLRAILPSVAKIVPKSAEIVAMVKPQFEASGSVKHDGVIKNERMRRDVLKDFESWAKKSFVIKAKADSEVAGDKGNSERFYLLKSL